jgi:aldose 1-epimerase
VPGSRPSPSGDGFVLRRGPYDAVVRAVGATLQRLRWNGRDLVLPFADDEVRPDFRGAVLAPWPNRVGGGSWEWRGQPLQLALTEPERGHAIHGLVAWSGWTPSQADEGSVTLATTVWPQPGYPFCIDLGVRWALDEVQGLTCQLTARNAGHEPAPFGCGIHPYLVAPRGTIDDWALHVPAAEELLVGDDLLPTGLVEVPPDHDFTTARSIAGAQMDNAFTGVTFDGRGQAAVTLVDDDGAGARISFTEATPWVQICTSDWAGPGHRAAVAVEPMTCPPNALQTGTDVLVLEPGQRHTTSWRLAAVVAPEP